jgi:hypothetical protein
MKNYELYQLSSTIPYELSTKLQQENSGAKEQNIHAQKSKEEKAYPSIL